MNYTNTPWVMHGFDDGWDIYSTQSEADYPIATVHRCEGRFTYEDEANAKLLLAAPKLLEMLACFVERDPHDNELTRRAREVMKEAT